MQQTIDLFWLTSLVIGIAGAVVVLLKGRVVFLGINVVAGVYSVVILDWLTPERAARIMQGNQYSEGIFLAPVVMWSILLLGAVAAVAIQRRRPAAA